MADITQKVVTVDLLGHFKDKMDESHQVLLDKKVDIVEGKELSDNNYSDEDKAKLDGFTLATEEDIDALFGF